MSFRPVLLLGILALGACQSSSTSDLEFRQDKVFTYAAIVPAGAPVYLRNLRGEILVEPSPDDSLRVTADLLWRSRPAQPDDVRFKAEVLPTGVLICSLIGSSECSISSFSSGSTSGISFRRSGDNIGLGGKLNSSVVFHVQVPSGVALDLLGVDTRITSASSARVKARTVNGDITVVTSVGPVNAETVNGDVDARMTTLSGADSVIVKTLNGAAWAFLPEAVAASVSASTTNGHVESDFAEFDRTTGNQKRFRASLGGGGTPVLVRTLNGTAGIGRLDAQGRSYPR